MCDLNSQPDETSMSNFMESYNFKNVSKLAACFKYHVNSFCRDLFLTNRSGCFEDNCIFGKRKMKKDRCIWFSQTSCNSFENIFKKQKPKTVKYRNYTKFNNHKFRSLLLDKLMYRNSQYKQLQGMIDSVLHFVNNKMPLKTHHFLANKVVFMAKNLSK